MLTNAEDRKYRKMFVDKIKRRNYAFTFPVIKSIHNQKPF